jgi:hypothetical protein
MKTNTYFRSYLASFFSDRSWIATLNIQFIFNNVLFFFENRAVYDKAAKYFRGGGGEQATEYNMEQAYCMPYT